MLMRLAARSSGQMAHLIGQKMQHSCHNRTANFRCWPLRTAGVLMQTLLLARAVPSNLLRSHPSGRSIP